MKNSKLLLPLIALLVGASIASVLTFTLTRDSKSASSEPSYLFVYAGKNAELTSIGDSKTEFTLTVPIESEDAKVAWFTDRPYRAAGHITYSELAYKFTTDEEDSFKADPPNVAIQIEDTTLIATMTVPKIIPWLNGGKAFAANFVLVPQEDHKDLISEESFLSQHTTRNTQDQHGGAQTLKEVSVFIDNAGATVYKVGDTGPGGGTIFYVAPQPFFCGFRNGFEDHCSYLEVAPTSGVNAWTDARYKWSANTNTEINSDRTNSDYYHRVGMGQVNTRKMIALDSTEGYAATISAAYRGPNNKNDWHLPSKDELELLYAYRFKIEGRQRIEYWSSSSISQFTAQAKSFNENAWFAQWKYIDMWVRPIRTF